MAKGEDGEGRAAAPPKQRTGWGSPPFLSGDRGAGTQDGGRRPAPPQVRETRRRRRQPRPAPAPAPPRRSSRAFPAGARPAVQAGAVGGGGGGCRGGDRRGSALASALLAGLLNEEEEEEKEEEQRGRGRCRARPDG